MSAINCKIAIIGVAARLPGGVRSCDDFWDLLINGVDGVTEIPASRWSSERFQHDLRSAPGRSVTFSAGVIDDIDFFDCKFFNISEREAQSMDPQQRLTLELTWEMFEDARIKPSAMAGTNTGVYVGASSMDAALSCSDDPWVMGPFSMTGNSLSIISNRLSFLYDLHGPSMTLDTACSSSMVALYEACKFLENDGGEFAVAGGVNSLYSPFPYIGFSKAQMLSDHGRCKVFDQDGNGYVRAEGGVLYLLKRLEDAQRDGDAVHGVITATGVNSDGMTQPGMSFPNIEGQKQLLSEVYGEGGIDPNTLSYVEAHGTGTAAGDPVEAGSLGAVLGSKRPGNPLLVGSVKSSIGHLEPASGAAGLLKSLLILKHKTVPPNIHLKTPLDAIDFKGLNIDPVRDAVPLPETGGPARIGVNSFGFGGANAHILVEEYTDTAVAESDDAQAVPPLFLSAASTASLRGLAKRYAESLEGDGAEAYAGLAANAVHQRELLDHRLVAQGDSPAEIATALATYAETGKADQVVIGQAVAESVKTAFVFSGNGAQWDGMGRALYGSHPLFKATIDEVDTVLSPMLGWSVAERMQREEGQEVNLTEVSQPMLLAYQIGLVRCFAAMGIEPDMVYGHSVGEVTAAYASGALSLEQACEVIYHRSVMQAKSLGTGRMGVAKCSVEEALALPEVVAGEVEVAASNSPSFVTLSGEEAGLKAIGKSLKKQGTIFRMLQLDYPFHSRHMDPLKDGLMERLGHLKPGPASTTFISAMSGQVAEGESLDGLYWWDNIRERVNFHEATQCALELGAQLFVEIGPNNVLVRFLDGTIQDAGASARVMASMRKGRDSGADFDQVWPKAYVLGAAMDYACHVGDPVAGLALPLYAWDKVNVTLQSSTKCTGLLKKTPSHPLLGFRKDGGVYVWENTVDSVLFPFLADHVIYGDVVMPGAGMVEIALAAACEISDQVEQEVVDLALIRPMPVPTSPAMDVRVTISPEDGAFRLESKPLMSEEQWTLHAFGRVALKADAVGMVSPVDVSRPSDFGEAVDVEQLYREAGKTGIAFGPGFRPMTEAYIKGDKGLVVLDATPRLDTPASVFDPVLLDGCFHTLLALIPHNAGEKLTDAFLPAWFGRVSMVKPGAIKYALVSLDKVTGHSAVASFELMNAEGELIGRLQECRYIRMKSRNAALKGQRAFSVDLVPISHPRRIEEPSFVSTDALYGLVEKDFDALALEYDRQAYYEELRPLCQAAILSHLHSLLKGALPAGFGFTISDMRNMGALDEELLPFVVYLLQFLQSLGGAKCEDGVWTLERAVDLPDAETVWRSIQEDYPAYLPETVVLGRLGMHLVNLLRGKKTVEEILSYEPGGLLEAFYTQSPSARFSNTQIVKLMEKLREQLPKGRPLRILEVGTGLGGLFSAVMASQPSEQLKYVCTDKDEEVLQQLKAVNAEVRHVEYTVLDIEQDLPESITPGCYDVVLVSHVLHELDNIDAALKNCRQLLAGNGILIGMERNPDPLIDIFMGVFPGWWKHSASPEEPESRLLQQEAWEQVLTDSGFVDCRTICEKDVDRPESYILLARKQSEPEEVPDCGGFALDENSLWVILEDVSPSVPAIAVRDGVIERLDAVDQHPVCITLATADEAKANPEAIDYSDVSQWEDALRRFSRANKPLKFIHMAGFDTDPEPEGARFKSLVDSRTLSVTMFARACEALKLEADFWLVSGGGLGGGSDKLDAVPSQASGLGATRVMANEVTSLTPRIIDLHCAMPDASLLDDMVEEMLFPGKAMEIVLKDGQRLIPRLVPLDRLLFENDPHTQQLSRISLTFDQPGKLDNLYWKQEMDSVPDNDEVLIRVRASGLNFRDVMFSMGMLPAEALEDGLSGPVLGLECSGEIMSVGTDVTEYQVGDEVMCMSGPCFDSHICVKTDYVFPKPSILSFEEAATIPVAFSTAYYSLKMLGNVKEGDRVLIHSAAGGVGLAAIQVANYLGAEIYATSGSEEKREFLKLLGVKNVMDSRSLSFYDRVLELTGGEGVDVVLNSLAGEALFKSLKLLKPFGRFLELGKRDFYSNTPLRMRMLRKNITFFGIDLDEFMAFKPQEGRKIFADLIELFEQGEFKPLMYSVFSRSAGVNAFKAMQRGKHIGKLVVAFDELHHGVRTLPKHTYKESQSASGTYLVTGGTGGFGLATAKRLVQNGAGNIILLSRSGAASAEAKSGVAELEAAGATVRVVSADVSDMEQLSTGLDAALADLPPLKGLVHSAAVLRDSMIANITPEQVVTALQAKAVGAWNLHTYTKSMALDFFIMYSSATTVLGNPGQVNYVAANTTLEALAQHRRALGLAATTYGWGPISDTGMLTAAPEVMESLKKVMGVAELSSEQALDYMELSPDQQYTNLFYFNLDWNRVRDLRYLNSTMFNWIEELSGAGGGRKVSADSAKSILAMDRDDAITALVEAIGIEVAAMLKVPYESMDTSVTIAELGLDSLMAVELGLLIEERYGVRVSSFSMNVNSDLIALSERIYEALVSGGKGDEAEDVAKTMREKHGINADSEAVSKVLESVNTELNKPE